MSGRPNAERPLVVVKLGGSVITRKREVERLRPKVLARLAHELASVKDHRLVVLHGAGSFGHPGARRFGLARPPAPNESPASRSRGASIVSAEVRRLHGVVLRALVGAGSAPWSVPIATHAKNRAGELVTFDATPFEHALERDLLPVSFGDVVPDDAWGTSILGADAIARELVPTLHPKRVVFVTDVPGILEGPPGGRRAVVPEVTDEVVRSLEPVPNAVDVTGGIRGKAAVMCAIARAGADAGLISGLTDGALPRAIRGDAVYGSWAHVRPG